MIASSLRIAASDAQSVIFASRLSRKVPSNNAVNDPGDHNVSRGINNSRGWLNSSQ
jgi:hypothetical protein